MFNSFDYKKSPDWYTVRHYFAEHLAPNDIVVQTTIDASFGYYINPLAQTIAVPASPTQTDNEIATIFEDVAKTSSSIWLYEHSKYAWDNANAAQAWLDAHWQPVTETTLQGHKLTRYKPKEVALQELEPTLNIAFGDSIVLQSLHLQQTSQDLTVWLYWQPPTTDTYTASIQLIGAFNPQNNNPIWAQSDMPLPASDTQTRDVRLLDLRTVPEGNYTLILKVYDPTNGEVLLVRSQEFYEMGEVIIPPTND
jgi:hypothetical protein